MAEVVLTCSLDVMKQSMLLVLRAFGVSIAEIRDSSLSNPDKETKQPARQVALDISKTRLIAQLEQEAKSKHCIALASPRGRSCHSSPSEADTEQALSYRDGTRLYVASVHQILDCCQH